MTFKCLKCLKNLFRLSDNNKIRKTGLYKFFKSQRKILYSLEKSGDKTAIWNLRFELSQLISVWFLWPSTILVYYIFYNVTIYNAKFCPNHKHFLCPFSNLMDESKKIMKKYCYLQPKILYRRLFPPLLKLNKDFNETAFTH